MITIIFCSHVCETDQMHIIFWLIHLNEVHAQYHSAIKQW